MIVEKLVDHLSQNRYIHLVYLGHCLHNAAWAPGSEKSVCHVYFVYIKDAHGILIFHFLTGSRYTACIHRVLHLGGGIFYPTAHFFFAEYGDIESTSVIIQAYKSR